MTIKDHAENTLINGQGEWRKFLKNLRKKELFYFDKRKYEKGQICGIMVSLKVRAGYEMS